MTDKIENTDEKDMATNSKADAMSAIDRAIAAAEARKAAKKASGAPETAKKAAGKKTGGNSSSRKTDKTSDDDKAAKKLAREQEREAAKNKRDAERAAKKAEKEASKKPAHMAKVMKAAEKLPKMNEFSEQMFGDITSNLSSGQIAALALHLQHFNRIKATERALTIKVEEGMEVTIIGGDPRYIGRTGTVTKAQRIRCYVEVDGLDKDVYCFTSDVEPTMVDTKTGTNG